MTQNPTHLCDFIAWAETSPGKPMSSNNKSRVITLSLEFSMSSYISMQQEFRCRPKATTELYEKPVTLLVETVSHHIVLLAEVDERADDNGLLVRMF